MIQLDSDKAYERDPALGLLMAAANRLLAFEKETPEPPLPPTVFLAVGYLSGVLSKRADIASSLRATFHGDGDLNIDRLAQLVEALAATYDDEQFPKFVKDDAA